MVVIPSLFEESLDIFLSTGVLSLEQLWPETEKFPSHSPFKTQYMAANFDACWAKSQNSRK